MFPCKQCTTPNSLDSTFCKHCGEPLTESELVEAKARLDELIAEGDSLFTQGRTEEAMVIAEAAVAANPSSARALSLKGMCHERMGHVAEALDCFEQVVANSPDSALDKLKVNQLRNLLVAGPPTPPPPDRKVAAMVAVSLGTLFVAIGIIGASIMTRPKDGVAVKTDRGVIDSGSPFTPQQPASGSNAPATGTPSTNTASVVADPKSTLPNTNANEGIPAPSNGPIGPLSLDFATPDKSTKPAVSGGDPAPKPDITVDPSPNTSADTGPTSHPIVDISISRPNEKVNGGGVDSSGANVVEALVKAARNDYQLGHYDAAARGYNRALRAGADAGSVYQRLGQCFEKLGKSTEAIAAYGHAVDAYQAAINSGRAGNGAQSALESCKLAMKLLQGN